MLPDHNLPIGSLHRDAMERRAAERGDVMGIPERTEPMTRAEMEAWAQEIGLTAAQWMPVWYVIGREYERGRAAADRGAVDPSDDERDWASEFQAAEAARDYWQGRAQALEAELNARPSTDRGAVHLREAGKAALVALDRYWSDADHDEQHIGDARALLAAAFDEGHVDTPNYSGPGATTAGSGATHNRAASREERQDG